MAVVSIAALNWALGMIAGGRAGSTATKLVLLRLADRADPHGVCWPGHETTAADLDLGQSTVVSAVRSLSTNGLLRIERRTDAAGRDLPNRYHLSLDAAPPPPRRQAKVSPADEGGVPDAGTRGADCGTGSPAVGPEPKDITKKNNPQNAEAAPSAPAGVDAAAFGKQHQKLRRVRKSGIVTYYMEDVQAAEPIEANWAPEEIALAIAAVRARRNARGNPMEPVPGLIEPELERLAAEQRRAHAAAEARSLREKEERRIAVQRADPASLARVKSMLSELNARLEAQ